MPRTKISEFSATPANNTDIDSINIAEGCAPSGINDAIRELMAQLKDFQTGAAGDSFNGPIGATTAGTGAFTTISATGAITSTLATGSAPLVIASTTKVTNLNADLLDGADWAAPASLGSTTPAAGAFTTLAASGAVTLSGGTANGVTYLNGSKVLTSGATLTYGGSGGNLTVGANGTAGNFETGAGGYGLVLSMTNVGPKNAIRSINNTEKKLFINDSAGGFTEILTYIDGSEAMRLTSSSLYTASGINVGIGTSSPKEKLDSRGAAVFSGDNTTGTNAYGTAAGILLSTSSDNTKARITAVSNGANSVSLVLRSLSSGSAVDAVTIDPSGNLGLGVTPSAWNTSNAVKALQFGGGSLWNYNDDRIIIAQNYYNAIGGADKYIANGYATAYRQYAGTHTWFLAPNNTSGPNATASLSDAMTLDASGNLFLGTTVVGNTNSDSFSFRAGSGGAGAAFINHSNGTASGILYVGFGYNGSQIGTITQSGTTAVAYNTSSDYRLKNITGPITTSGAYIDSLNPVEGTWKADGSTFVGLIAHEVQEASRTTVATGTKDGAEMQGMDYSSAEIIANLIAEVQSLRQRLSAANL
jgi:hypothetical protein